MTATNEAAVVCAMTAETSATAQATAALNIPTTINVTTNITTPQVAALSVTEPGSPKSTGDSRSSTFNVSELPPAEAHTAEQKTVGRQITDVRTKASSTAKPGVRSAKRWRTRQAAQRRRLWKSCARAKLPARRKSSAFNYPVATVLGGNPKQ